MHQLTPIKVGTCTVDIFLSEWQLEILRLVADGNTQKEVAASLGVERTVIVAALVRIMEVLGARNSAHAVAQGFKRGVLE